MLRNCSFRKTEQVEVEKTFSGSFFQRYLQAFKFVFLDAAVTRCKKHPTNKIKSKGCVYTKKRQMFMKIIRATA